MPLAHQPKDVESYKLKIDEVKMLRPNTTLPTVNFYG